MLSAQAETKVKELATSKRRPIIDAVVEAHAASEAAVLRCIATRHGTSFVSTEKIARLKVAPDLIKLIPQRLAEQMLVLPVRDDPRSGKLTVLAGDLEEYEVAKHLQMSSGRRSIEIFVARPSAIFAAIKKHYEGDTRAFASVYLGIQEARPEVPVQGQRPADPQEINSRTMAPPSRAAARPKAPPPPSPPRIERERPATQQSGRSRAEPRLRVQTAGARPSKTGSGLGVVGAPTADSRRGALPTAASDGSRASHLSASAEGSGAQSVVERGRGGATTPSALELDSTLDSLVASTGEAPHREDVGGGAAGGLRRTGAPAARSALIELDAPDFGGGMARQDHAAAARVSAGPGYAAGATGIPQRLPVTEGRGADVPRVEVRPGESSARVARTTQEQALEAAALAGPVATQYGADEGVRWDEAFEVFVTLLEQGKGGLRGHSPLVARWVVQLAERLGLEAREVRALRGAALLHDLGQTEDQHITLQRLADTPGLVRQAERAYRAPMRLLESASLPSLTIEALTHRFERFDGTGFPKRLAGRDIPVGARLIALAETYADLTMNDAGKPEGALAPKAALERMERLAEEAFDPDLLAVLRELVLGAGVDRPVQGGKATLLLVDEDPEDGVVLEVHLSAQGYDVVLARSLADAQSAMGEERFDLVISEVHFADGSGFDLLRQLREQDYGGPWIFLTKQRARSVVLRAFELGAADFLAKPVPPEVVLAKVQQHLSEQTGTQPMARGVQGSLKEMALPDVLQILSNGRKSGSLSITGAAGEGVIYFVSGHVYDAHFRGQAGEDAFYALLGIEEGSFQLDPANVRTDRTIHRGTEMLLLEGMRRLDESRR